MASQSIGTPVAKRKNNIIVQHQSKLKNYLTERGVKTTIAERAAEIYGQLNIEKRGEYRDLLYIYCFYNAYLETEGLITQTDVCKIFGIEPKKFKDAISKNSKNCKYKQPMVIIGFESVLKLYITKLGVDNYEEVVTQCFKIFNDLLAKCGHDYINSLCTKIASAAIIKYRFTDEGIEINEEFYLNEQLSLIKVNAVVEKINSIYHDDE